MEQLHKMQRFCSDLSIRSVWESKHVHVFISVHSHKHLHLLDTEDITQDIEKSVCVCARVAWTYIWMFTCTWANRWMFYCWRLFHFCFHFSIVGKVLADKPSFKFVLTDASTWSAKSTFRALNWMLIYCRWFITTTWCDVIYCTH